MKKRVFWKLIRNVLVIMVLILSAGRIGHGIGAHKTQEACLEWRVTEASCQQYLIEAESQGKHLKWMGK